MKARAVACALAISSACMPSPRDLEPSRNEWLQLRGDHQIAKGAPIEFEWGRGLRLVGTPEVRALGEQVAAELEGTTFGARLLPKPSWPEGELEVSVSGCLETEDGSLPDWLPIGLTVVSSTMAEVLDPVVRRPAPGSVGPSNLAWLAVEAPAELSTLTLRSEDGARFLAAREGRGDVFRVEPGFSCSSDCAGRSFQLEGYPSGVLRSVRTSSSADLQTPLLSKLVLDAAPGALELELLADETVRGGGGWRAAGASGRFASLGFPGTSVRLGAEPAPPGGADIEIDIWIEDLAGARTSTRTIISMPERVEARITELVFAPRRDWGDSEPNGEPFDAYPGSGTVSSADEWIELVNLSGRTVSLARSGLELRALDGTPAVTKVVDAPRLRFGDGGGPASWLPGEALVVRTRGDMAQGGLVVELWSGAMRVDRVVIGREVGADHAGGGPPDLDHDALARTGRGDWAWCRPTPGDPAPSGDCR